MNCPNCGRQLDGQPKFCRYCGTPLPAVPDKKVRSGKKVTRWIVLGLIFAAILALGINMISERIKSQQVTQEHLDDLVSEFDDAVETVGEYVELRTGRKDGVPIADLALKLELAENGMIRDRIGVEQSYNRYRSRKGWDADKYEDYEALYEACCALLEFAENYDDQDPDSLAETYDSLLETYRELQDDVT